MRSNPNDAASASSRRRCPPRSTAAAAVGHCPVRVRGLVLVAAAAVLLVGEASAWSSPSSVRRHHSFPALLSNARRATTSLPAAAAAAASDDDDDDESSVAGSEAAPVDPEYLRRELLSYLAKRKEVGADELAEAEVGKKSGGTRGNVVLEYVSLAPNKGSTVEAAPNAFDYSELEKYGYSRLATPIMEAGGRLAMYDLLGLDRPAAPLSARKRKKPAPEIVIDRTGQNDSARYAGLKVGLQLDDSAQAAALEEAQRKTREGESLRPRLIEEDYERPYADNPKAARQEQGYWTADRLDEWGKRRGETLAEMERAKQDSLVLDGSETTDLEPTQRVYSAVTAVAVAIAFGRSTPTFLSSTLHLFSSPDDAGLAAALDVFRAPAAALLLASVGSGVYCALQAPDRRRSPSLWAYKGLLGGPVAVRELRGLPRLRTGREITQDLENAEK